MQGPGSTRLFWLGFVAFAGCETDSPCDRIEAGEGAPSTLDADHEIVCVDVMVDGNECGSSRMQELLRDEICGNVEEFHYDRMCAFEDEGTCCYVFEDFSYNCYD